MKSKPKKKKLRTDEHINNHIFSAIKFVFVGGYVSKDAFPQSRRATALPLLREMWSLVPCSLDLGNGTETAALESLHPPALKLAQDLANQNHYELPLHTNENGYCPKDKRYPGLAGMQRKGNPCARSVEM